MRLMPAVLSLLLLSTSVSVAAQPWIYYDIRDTKNQFLLETHPDRSAWMDSEGDATFCGKSSDMLCFKVNTFRFAIPKKIVEVGAEWQHDGVLYRLAGKSRHGLLGKNYSIDFVDAKFDKYQMRFLFSRESGLVGITTIDPTPGLFLLLDGKCGFGAPPSCSYSK